MMCPYSKCWSAAQILDQSFVFLWQTFGKTQPRRLFKIRMEDANWICKITWMLLVRKKIQMITQMPCKKPSCLILETSVSVLPFDHGGEVLDLHINNGIGLNIQRAKWKNPCLPHSAA